MWLSIDHHTLLSEKVVRKFTIVQTLWMDHLAVHLGPPESAAAGSPEV